MKHLATLLYAWLSGLIFVLSLLYFTYFFLTLNEPPDVDNPFVAFVINFLLFGIFAAHHSFMARTGAKRWLARYLPLNLERATYVWVASVLFAITCLLWRDLPGTVYEATGWLKALALVAQAAGLAIIALAISILDPLELAGLRKATELRIHGPYRWVRHPVYLGWILIVFGGPNMPTTRLVFAAISTTYLVLAIPWEERSMSESFGSAYQRYLDRVRWKILPGLW
jgi:protein-S-isoprenylcysteine O-methyltransferase Ste14